MKLHLDPWPADYESPIAFGEEERALGAAVDITVESKEWRVMPREPVASGVCCYFVDGVRRIEARVLAEGEDGSLIHGLFGSIASGFVRASGPVAEFGEIWVERLLVAASEQVEGRDLTIGQGTLRFEACAATENSPAGALTALQNQMRTAEGNVAQSLAERSGCVFVDGLSYGSTSRRDVVGVIKRIMEPYLRPAEFALVAALRSGERTPIFSIGEGRNQRYTCFLRLAEPREIDHALAGIVRLEMGSEAGVETAKRLAAFGAATLPRFASSQTRDPRAPQNLAPVGALEQEMRRRLGDPMLIRRAIEREIHEQRNR